VVPVKYSAEAAVFDGEKFVPQTSFYTITFRKITALSVIIFWYMKLHGWENNNKDKTFGGISYISFQGGR
jgi:hypothetical protein